jgi:large subunit ribosomal protein L23
MRDLYRIIKRPLITERGTHLKEKENKYLFEVSKAANKLEIKRAIEFLFHVHVASVHTISVKGKEKKVGRFVGKTPDSKKAVVALREGDSIEFIEGV